MDLVAFSQTTSAADFQPGIDAAAESVGIDPNQQFILDGTWQTRSKGLTKADNGKVKYCGDWRTSKAGVRYLVVTLYTYRHGGQSATYNGFEDMVALFSRGCIPAKPAQPKPAPKEKTTDFKKCRVKNQELWRSTLSLTHRDAEPVRTYLRYRGLGTQVDNHDLPKTLRFHPALEYWDGSNGKPVLLGNYPALVAAVQAADNTAVSLHRTYLQADGNGKADVPSPKKIMPPSRANGLRGAAIKLYSATEQLAIAEGIETALAIRAATGLPVWSCISTFGMKSFAVPNNVREVLIFADNDTHQAGIKAANALAARLYRQKITARIITPITAGSDFLDVLNGGIAA